MKHNGKTAAVALKSARCPYCGQKTTVDLPSNYAPVYEYCDACGKKFIAERLRQGFHVIPRENAPCYSDPDCRELEMAGYDEE